MQQSNSQTATGPKKQKIVYYRGDRAACWMYRAHIPMVQLAKNNKDKYDILITGQITRDHLDKCDFDLVVLQRQYKFDVLAPIMKIQKKGVKLVYEIDDDLFRIPAWNPASRTLGVKKVQDGIKEFISRVDAMWVTTKDLADVYKNYCEHIYVLPNCIDFDYIFTFPSNETLPVVCWQGSMTHEKDLAIAKKGFEQIAQDNDLILKMWCGYKPRTKKPMFNIPGAQIIPLVPFEGFYQMFSQVGTDIGLAPLAANQFNKSKSNLKFLEYTAFNAVTVASDFGPYRNTIEDGVTGLLVSDNRDWYDKVRMLIDDPDLRQCILTNAKAFVNEHYNIEKKYHLWQNSVIDLIGESNG